MDSLFTICFGGIFYIGAPLLIGYGIYYVYLVIVNPKRAVEAEQWEQVDGKLTLVHQLGRTGLINNLDIRYDFIYKGEKYTGKRITLYPNMYFGKERFEEVKQTYQEGDPVTVYVHPAKPEKSIIQTDLEDFTTIYTIWGIVNLILGVFLTAVIIAGLGG